MVSTSIFYVFSCIYYGAVYGSANDHDDVDRPWTQSQVFTFFKNETYFWQMCPTTSFHDMLLVVQPVEVASHDAITNVEEAVHDIFSTFTSPRMEITEGNNLTFATTTLYRIVLKEDSPSCIQFSFFVNESTPLAFFTQHRLENFKAEIRNQNGDLISAAACGDGCEENTNGLTGTKKWAYTLLASFVACMTALVGVVALMFNRRVFMSAVDYMTSFAAGSLIATVMFHVYPEASEYLTNQPEWKTATLFIAGLLTGMMVEQGLHMLLHMKGVSTGILHGNDHSDDHCHALESPKYTRAPTPVPGEPAALQNGENGFQWLDIKPVAYVVTIGDFLHGFTDGILIAIGFQSCNSATGWLITFGVVLHEVPHRVSDFFILVQSGLSIAQAVFINFCTSLSTVLGAILLLSVGDIQGETLGYILAFGSGTFLFISMGNLLPPLLHEMNPKKAAIHYVSFIAGVIVIGLTMLNSETHCDAE